MKFKRIVVFLHDLLWVPLAIAAAFWIRDNLSWPPSGFGEPMVAMAVIATVVHSATFWLFGCYRGMWRFASLSDLLRLVRAVLIGLLITGSLLFIYSRLAGIPRSVMVLYPMFLLAGVSASRVFYRLVVSHARHQQNHVNRDEQPRALIIGAGRAGELLIRDILEQGPAWPVGILDDAPEKQGTDIHGVRVRGRLRDLKKVIAERKPTVVLIAMPSAPLKMMDQIVRDCAEMGITCRTLPSLLELADGQVQVDRLRPVTVDDLLGREPVTLDEDAITAYLQGKTVMVTGGGGSIGSELCRQVLAKNPSKLIIAESSEYNLYTIDQELEQLSSSTEIVPALLDVRIKQAVDQVFRMHSPDVVFHAAAYKHVPMVEHNVIEGVRNNVLGTRTIADAACEFGVSTFVLVSTDKTVNPTNVMGATKRIAEIYCQTLNSQVDTPHFVTTRFGNVLGSAGSVVPLFEKQIKSGGPLTVTHSEITRYFMTIPEAASLILQGGSMGNGGEIFVLDMGKPIHIKSLAENMIRLSGLQPHRDIEIEYVGLRPGEKMHEELFYSKEELMGTEHPKLMLANSIPWSWELLEGELHALQRAVDAFDEAAAVACIKRLVPEFNRYLPKIKGEDIAPNQSGTGLRVVK